jgi:hypothetical protein
MKKAALANRRRMSLIVCGLCLTHPFSLAAQETTQKQPKEPLGQRSAQERRALGRPLDIVTEMQKLHKQTKKLHQEMTQELQQQLTALRAHTQAMEGISDEKQQLVEMKKHLQMIDELLGTMVEQRATLEARMKERREQLWHQLGKTPQTEEQEREGHDEDK